MSTALQWGYLTYEKCASGLGIEGTQFNNVYIKGFVDIIYFSSITFFTIGYGDICPMGINKIIAIFNALAGHIFTAIVMVLALANYLIGKKKKRRP